VAEVEAAKEVVAEAKEVAAEAKEVVAREVGNKHTWCLFFFPEFPSE